MSAADADRSEDTLRRDAATARENLAAVAAESGMTFGELLALWSEDTALQLATAGAALDAGNLREAARLVHGASGAAGLCGVDDLARQLTHVESLAVAGDGGDAAAALVQARTRFTRLCAALHEAL